MTVRKLAIQTVWRPKRGHSPDEYEDAFALSGDTLPLRAAVADGATESAFSGGWARAVAQQYVHAGPDAPLRDAIQQARRSWTPPHDARWYVAAKAEQGAHAAVLGLQIDPNGWRAEAVGDCCLFWVRGGQLLESFPMASASEFSHRPALISSLDESAQPKSASGTWKPDDTFLLATDAFAAWLLAQEVFPDLADLDGLFERARTAGMRNDDVTALRVTI